MQFGQGPLLEWLQATMEALDDEETGGELRKLSLRGHPTSSRMKGAEEIWTFEPLGAVDLPPPTALLNAAWASVLAHGAEDFKVVQGRAQLEGGGELPSKQWSGPGVSEEAAPARAQEQTSAPVVQDYKTAHPTGVTRESELVHCLSVLVDHTRAIAQHQREMSRTTLDLAKAFPGIVQSLGATNESLAKSLVKARVSEAEARRDAIFADAEAEQQAAELEAMEAENGLVEMAMTVIISKVLDRYGVGLSDDEKRAAAVDALSKASPEQLKEMAKHPAIKDLLPRVATAYAEAQAEQQAGASGPQE